MIGRGRTRPLPASTIPDEVKMKAGIPAKPGRPSLVGPGRLHGLDLENWGKQVRLQQRKFEVAVMLTREYRPRPS